MIRADTMDTAALALLLAASLSCFVSASATTVHVGTMRGELAAACARGECRAHSNESSVSLLKNTTDCHGRLLAYEYSLTLIPARAPQVEVFDALELEGCGVTRHWRDCHIADIPSPSLSKHLLQEEGGAAE